MILGTLASACASVAPARRAARPAARAATSRSPRDPSWSRWSRTSSVRSARLTDCSSCTREPGRRLASGPSRCGATSARSRRSARSFECRRNRPPRGTLRSPRVPRAPPARRAPRCCPRRRRRRGGCTGAPCCSGSPASRGSAATRVPTAARGSSGLATSCTQAGYWIPAGAAVVVERHRRQHDRNRGGRGRRARQANLVQVRAEQVEVVLEEREPRAGRDVGPGRDRDRPGLVEKIAEGRALEQDLVVVLRGEFRTPGATTDELPPVERIEGARRPARPARRA